MAMFRYEKVVGCRSTNSSQHSQLPVPSRRHRAAEGFTCEPRLRVGFEYIYIDSHDYAVVDGKVQVAHWLPTSKLEQQSENERVLILVEQLKRFAGERFTSMLLEVTTITFAPFRVVETSRCLEDQAPQLQS